jgi:hypothetical protein
MCRLEIAASATFGTEECQTKRRAAGETLAGIGKSS